MSFVTTRQYPPSNAVQVGRDDIEYVNLAKLGKESRRYFWQQCQKKRPKLAETIEQLNGMRQLIPGSEIMVTRDDYDDVMGRKK